MPSNLLNSSYKDYYIYGSIGAGLLGILLTILNFSLMYFPVGRFYKTSPATSAWIGIQMIYLSLLCFQGFNKLYFRPTQKASFFMRIIGLKNLWYFYGVAMTVASLSLIGNPVSDYISAFWYACNVALILIIIELGN